jgi:hypothetical protein
MAAIFSKHSYNIVERYTCTASCCYKYKYIRPWASRDYHAPHTTHTIAKTCSLLNPMDVYWTWNRMLNIENIGMTNLFRPYMWGYPQIVNCRFGIWIHGHHRGYISVELPNDFQLTHIIYQIIAQSMQKLNLNAYTICTGP